MNFSIRMAACAIALAAATTAGAQVSYETAAARVEVLGLRRWTLRMLQDSIGHYVKGQKLEDAACMVTLRDSLHFVEASVTTYNGFGPPGSTTKDVLVVMVVEPQEAATVKWDVRPRNEFVSLRPDYAPIVLPVTDSLGGFWVSRIDRWVRYAAADSTERARALASVPEKARASATADAERVWHYLDTHRGDVDRTRALASLRGDAFHINRYAAALTLMNFAASDSTWWALARAMRDPHERVRGAARTALSGMPPRTVDWTPVANDLRLLLGGTNLPGILYTMEVLTQTSVSPSLAPQLLAGNGRWILDHVSATYPTASQTARKLLVQLHGGTDLGASRAAWEKWINSLSRGSP